MRQAKGQPGRRGCHEISSPGSSLGLRARQVELDFVDYLLSCVSFLETAVSTAATGGELDQGRDTGFADYQSAAPGSLMH